MAGLAAIRCTPATSGQDILPPVAKLGGTLRVSVMGEFGSLDPHGGTALAQVLTGPVYRRLVRPRSGLGVLYDSADVGEDLAEAWEQSDELTHIFYLRRGVRWHDIAPVNGREVISDDVKASFERLAAMKSTSPASFLSIDRVEIPDQYTVKVVLKEPQPGFIAAVANTQARIIPHELADGDVRRLAIGSGPFVLERSMAPAVGNRVILRRNPSYFRSGVPYLDTIEIVLSPDRASELALFKNGLVDVGPEPFGLLPGEADSARNGDLQVVRMPRPTMTMLGFNTARPPFNDVRIRKAISLVLDRRRLAADAYGEQIQLTGHLPNAFLDLALSAEEVERLFGKRDVARARALWADVNPSELAEVTVLVSPQADSLGLVEHLAEQLRELGLRMRPIRPETSTILTRSFTERMYDMALVQPGPSLDQEDWLGSLYGSTSTRNVWNYVDRRFDDLIVRSKRGTDREVRRKALLEVQHYLADKQPTTPLFSPMQSYLQSNIVKGWNPHWSGGLPGVEEAWISRPADQTPVAKN